MILVLVLSLVLSGGQRWRVNLIRQVAADDYAVFIDRLQRAGAFISAATDACSITSQSQHQHLTFQI